MDEKSQGLRTLTGIPYAELPALLDAELPASAYKAVPGGADLTDISPAHMRKVLNQVFGLGGYGWGYSYESQDMTTFSEMREGSRGERLVIVAVLKHLRFWYRLVDANGAGTQLLCQIDASGGSENANAGYAMKGAITNALGNAVSNIGFQESVYMGERSHHDFDAQRKAAEQAAAATKAAAAKAALAGKPAAAPAPAKPAPVEEPEIEELDAEPVAPAAKANPGDFIIPVGKNKGMKMSEIPSHVVDFYATKMAVSSDEARAIREAAIAFLAQAS